VAEPVVVEPEPDVPWPQTAIGRSKALAAMAEVILRVFMGIVSMLISPSPVAGCGHLRVWPAWLVSRLARIGALKASVFGDVGARLVPRAVRAARRAINLNRLPSDPLGRAAKRTADFLRIRRSANGAGSLT
jgi:hypothetical protein